MKNSFVPRMMLAGACLLSIGGIARAEDRHADSPPTVSISGDAILDVVPDKAIVTLSINTTSAALSDAEKNNESKGHVFVGALTKMGIDLKQIATSEVSITILYRRDSSGREADIDGYQATRQYTVTLTDIKRVQQVIDTGVANGVNTLSGVQYEDTQARKHRDEARRMAAKAAKEKAADLVAVFDCEVGPPLSIRENEFAVSAYMGNMYSNAGGFGGGRQQSEDGDDSIQPGQLKVHASVTVDFMLLAGVPKK